MNNKEKEVEAAPGKSYQLSRTVKAVIIVYCIRYPVATMSLDESSEAKQIGWNLQQQTMMDGFQVNHHSRLLTFDRTEFPVNVITIQPS